MARTKRHAPATTKGNSRTKPATIRSIMRAAAFVRGFADVRENKPFAEVAFKDQWEYERGRQFAVIFKGAIKDGRRVRFDALTAYRDAIVQKAIL